jgi:hypothetical protein
VTCSFFRKLFRAFLHQCRLKTKTSSTLSVVHVCLLAREEIVARCTPCLHQKQSLHQRRRRLSARTCAAIMHRTWAAPTPGSTSMSQSDLGIVRQTKSDRNPIIPPQHALHMCCCIVASPRVSMSPLTHGQTKDATTSIGPTRTMVSRRPAVPM